MKVAGFLAISALCFTTASGKWTGRRWANIPCKVGKGEVVASKRLPEGTTTFIINAHDKRDFLVNSELIVIKP